MPYEIKDSKGECIEAYTLHSPGLGKKNFAKLLNDVKKTEIKKCCDDITIVTTATSDLADKYPLIEQLNKSNISYLNSAKEFDGKWKRTVKIPLIKNIMKEVTTPYTLLLDANDVVLLKDIDEKFLETWKEYNCDMVFNGQWCMWPRVPSSTIESDKQSPFYYHYFNAGVCLGYTDKIAQLYNRAEECLNSKDYHPIDSEQYFLRMAMLKEKDIKIKIDDGCHLFFVAYNK